MREMWMKPAPEGDTSPIKVPGSLQAALALCASLTLLFGVLPGIVAKFGNLSDLAGAFGH
jgi:NADH-quinone oxidoreductase subunit N